ncbi:MAG: type II toxin-antitoxin system RelE/ParE family toxin [Isosphaeraceae bacterium]
MILPIRLLPEARAELADAVDWYEDRQRGVGTRFFTEIQAVFNRIAANPQLHATVHGPVRKAVVRRFPYVVLDREEAEEVIIISVFHTSRNPSIWQARI